MASSLPTQLVDVLSVPLSNLKGNQQPGRNKKKEKIIVRVGIKMKMVIIMTRTRTMMGGTSNLSVR